MLKQRIEKAFARLGEIAFDRPWYFVAFAALFVLFFVWQLQYLQIDTSTEGFLKKNDPDLVAFEQFKQTFGRDEQFIVALESPAIFTRPFLERLTELHQALEAQVPYVAEVDSLYNVRDIYGDEDQLVVADLLETLPQTNDELRALREKVLASELYRNSYISTDGSMTNIYLRPEVYARKVNEKNGEVEYRVLADREIQQMASAIRAVMQDGYQDMADSYWIAGSPAMTDELSVYLVGDMLRFILMALVMISLVLFILFRRLLSVVLPLLVMTLALLTTMGLMSLTSQPVQLPTVILPSFILAVGVCNAIHLLTIFFRRMKFGDAKRAALANALAHTGLPLFFTSLTTAASLLSFSRSEVLPVANLGLFAAAGVSFSFFYTIVLLPSLIALAPVKISRSEMQNRAGDSLSLFDRFLRFSIAFSAGHSKKIVAGGVLLMLLAAWSASQLVFSHDVLKWLPQSSSARQAIEHVSDKMGVSVSMEVIVDSGRMDGIRNAELLQAMDDLGRRMGDYQTPYVGVGKVISITDMIKETNQALFANDPAQYRIPDNDPLVAQEMLMLETSGADLFRLVDGDYQKGRITVMTPWVDALHFGDFVRDIESMASEAVTGMATVTVTGIIPILAKTLRKMMTATAVSYLIAFVVITFMMIALLGSVRYGLISMLPNVLPITLAMGLMNVTGAPLDMYSMLIGSIAIGLSVDDTVHFMHGFRRVLERTGNALQAVEETLHSTGRAMLSTTIVLSLGFLIYLFSGMNNLQDFGLYTTVCIVTALLADFWMAPALVLLLNRHKT